MSRATSGPLFRDRAIGEIAASLPGASAIFREYHLNFCCGGDMPLAEAATRRGIDVGEIAIRLAGLRRQARAGYPPDTDGLIEHIVRRYHDAHRRELPELIRLASRVEIRHQGDAAVPAGLADALERLQDQLVLHMQREEKVLFPVMQIEGGRPSGQLMAESRREHAGLGACLRGIEAIAGDLRPPEGACRSWQALYAGTAGLVNDVMEHVHLENNVLFPRFESSGA